jgi:hypothetical protein
MSRPGGFRQTAARPESPLGARDVWQKALSGREPTPSCSRQEARPHRPKAPSIDMCLLRRSRIAGHPPPLPRLCRRWISFRCLTVSSVGRDRLSPPRSLWKDRPATSSWVHHPGAGQVGHRMSTSAIITVLQHEPRRDQPPRAPHWESPPCALETGSPAPRDARPAKLSLSQGPPRITSPRQHLPRDRSLGSFAPTRSARAPHVATLRLRRPEKPNAG